MPDAIAGGILTAALLIFLIRLSFSLWGKGSYKLSLATGIPAAIYAFGLIMASAGFGRF